MISVREPFLAPTGWQSGASEAPRPTFAMRVWGQWITQQSPWRRWGVEKTRSQNQSGKTRERGKKHNDDNIESAVLWKLKSNRSLIEHQCFGCGG